MSANGTQTAAQAAAKPAPVKGPAIGSIVRYVLESDGEHEPTIRAAIVLSVDGARANLGVLLDGESDYKHVEMGNSQLSASVREGALLTMLRRVRVECDPEGFRLGTWHRAHG